MKKLFLSTLIVSAAVTAASCSKESTPKGEGPAEVRFSSAISRASGTSWETGDRIGVYMVATGTNTVKENASNKPYAFSSGSSFAATGDDRIYFPSSGNVDFIAYYPYNASVSGYTYPVDVAVQASQQAIDLMRSDNATDKAKTTAAVELTFTHQLSRIVFSVLKGTGLTSADFTAMTVKINGMNTAASFDVATGTLSGQSTVADITAKAVTAGSLYHAIVLPATVATPNTVSLELALNNTDGDVFTWSIPAATVFAAGQERTFNITLSRTLIDVTATITEWGNGGSDDVTIK